MNCRNFNVNNWGLPPYNRTSFQCVQTLFPTDRLQRNVDLKEDREVKLRDLTDVKFVNYQGDSSTVLRMLEDGFTDAFLVSHRGVLVTDFYDNGMTKDQHHLVNSVTKTFVGMLAGVVVSNGQLDPEKAVTEYLPELSNGAWAGTTVRQVLDMTAGASYQEDYDNPTTDFWKESAVVGWRPNLINEGTPYSLHDYAASLRSKSFSDGEKFDYKTVMTNVLGMLLEKASGQSLMCLLQDHLWAQLPMRQDGVIVVDKVGFPYVGAGLNACARDLLTFGELIMRGGTYKTEQVIPNSWIEDTLNGDADGKSNFNAGAYGEVFQGWHYRNQMWVSDKPGEMLAIGIHGQLIYINVPAQVVAVKLSTYPVSADVPRVMDTYLAVNAIAAFLG